MFSVTGLPSQLITRFIWAIPSICVSPELPSSPLTCWCDWEDNAGATEGRSVSPLITYLRANSWGAAPLRGRDKWERETDDLKQYFHMIIKQRQAFRKLLSQREIPKKDKVIAFILQ